jgi:hypothetical protein
MTLLVVVSTELRLFHMAVESAEPPRVVAREVVKDLRRQGHRFGEVRAVQVFELGPLQWSGTGEP